MTHSPRSARLAVSALLGALALGRTAAASNALEFPDNGVAAFSRGGAWLATATDPIAGHYNPAALATMPTSFGVGGNFVFQKICFTRLDASGAPATYRYDTDGTPTGAPYPETCNLASGRPRFIPNLAFAWRGGERWGVGLAVVPPSSLGATEWPTRATVTETTLTGGTVTVDRPAPQRYLSLGVIGTILFPTLSVGVEVAPGLRFGAGAIAGFAILELNSMGIGTQQASAPYDTFGTDSRSKLEVEDWFIPGFVLSSHWSASRTVDLAAWYRWLDTIHATGDFEGRAPYFDGASRPVPIDDPSVYVARSTAQGEEFVSVEQTVPMEVRVGLRFHQPFAPARGLEAERLPEYAHTSRDPLRDDAWDIELDLTWANNSAASATKIRMADDIPMQSPDGRGVPGTVPRNLDRPTGYQDSFGARLGGQFNVSRNKAGLRWGTWVETSAVDERYLTVTGVPGLRGGFGGGTVLRVHAFDVELGYQHVWNAGLDNGGDGALRAIVGSGPPDNRSYHAVNGGRIRQHANIFSAGLVARF